MTNQNELSTIESSVPDQLNLLNLTPGQDLSTVIQSAEKNTELTKRIKQLALSVTNRHDWVDQQGKPYLQSSGCEKIRPLFNISWEVDDYVRENEENGHFSYSIRGNFMMGGQKISVIGARSTKDPFFKQYEYIKDKNGKKVIKLDEYGNKVEQPKANIDATDIKKAAYSNFIMQGITRILGIRNLTYEEVEKYTGITRNNITSVTYNSSSNGNGSYTNGSSSAASEKQIGFLRKLLENAGLKDKGVSAINDLKILSREIKTSSDLTSKEASQLIEHFTQSNNNK